MKRLTCLLAVASLSACGDNSKTRTCGPGTEEQDGVCLPTGPGTPTCTDGTILDSETNSCVIDPNACQDGTVLIGNQCVDPTDGLTVDVTEAAEPNGAGVVETSTTPAGELTLKPIGQKLVIKGNTNPFQDALGDDGQLDADYDTYFFEVTAPTLLEITSDGVGGTASAFIVLPVQSSNPLNDSAWIRYGLNVTGDTSKRQVYIPTAGIYALTFADTRSMYLDNGSPPAAGYGGAAGSPNAFYYATVEQLAIPTPTAVALTDGEGTATGATDGTVHFYTATMGTGLARVVLDGDGPATAGAVTATRNGIFKEAAPAEAGAASGFLALGFRESDTTVIAADFVYHYAPGPQPYELTIKTSNATQLVDGATAPVNGTDVADLFNFNVFYYDIDGANATVGMNVLWDQPVTGFIASEEAFIEATFTDGEEENTFTTYNGLLRHELAGRHYFFVLAPGAEPTDSITATQGDVVRRTPAAIVKGTPLADVPADAEFKSTAFTYAPGTAADGWQQFLVSGSSSGAVSVRYFDIETAYGRLDAVTTTEGAYADTSPVFSHSFTEGATAPRGRVLLDDNVSNYFVVVTPTTNASAQLDIDFERRANYTDVTVVAGTPQTFDDQLMAADGGVQRYLVRTAVGNKLDVFLHPDGTGLDAVIDSVDRTEVVRRDSDNDPIRIDNTLEGANEEGTLRPVGAWTALVAYHYPDPEIALTADETFDLELDAIPPFYTVSNGTTAFADACTGGMVQTLIADDEEEFPADDEGTTGAITLPTGFDFYGNPVSEIYVSSNGFLSFDPLDFSYYQGAIPDSGDPNHLVAPYWVDLVGVTVCTKTVGSKFVVQWTGAELDFIFTYPVQFQAIIDTSNETIEFVYGPDQDTVADGLYSTIGVENEDGSDGQTLGLVGPNTSRLFTPTP